MKTSFFHLIWMAGLLLSQFVIASDHSDILDKYSKLALLENPTFTGFSSQRGQNIFYEATGGKPSTPNCTSCHGKDSTKPGKARTGKTIKPMASSVNPSRYTDIKKTEKWFRRNCKSVLGRTCTAQEKGDFITYMLNQ